MTKETNNWKIRLLGVAYILISLLAYFNSLYYSNAGNIFWFCYLGILIIGIGMLAGNSDLIKSQLYVLLIPNLIWTIDFLSFLIRGSSLWGITEYFFLAGPLLPKIVSLQHLITIPVALYVFYCLKLRRNSIWVASLLQLAILFFITRAFTSPGLNINCAYRTCGNFLPFLNNYYPWIWLLAGLMMIILTRFILLAMGGLWKPRIEDIYD